MTTTSQILAGKTDLAPRFARLVIPTIFIVTVFNYMDRAVLSILLEDIGRDLNLSDTQLGLLSSLPFALLYALVGLPFARVADVWNRKILIALAVAGWSIATAACGLAAGFWSLFLLRLCVGIGEGAGTPATHSVLAEFSGVHKRSLAASTLTLAAAVGGFVGLAGGGYFLDQFGWRLAFILIGLPGLLVGGLVLVFLPETRANPRLPTSSEVFGQKLGEVLKRQFAFKSYRLLLAGFVLIYFVQTGVMSWLAVYLMRSFSLPATEVGVILGAVSALSMGLGSILGGIVGSRLAALNPSWLLGLPAILALAMFPCLLAVLMLSPGLAMYAAIAVYSLIIGAAFGPLFAAQYALSTTANRATVVALTAIFTNVLGYGLGALVIGGVSDLLASVGVEQSLRTSMIMASFLFIPGAALFALGARKMADDLSADGQS
jgi:predicted MFS family arabinose efflux permease